jgi:hypothetical protein
VGTDYKISFLKRSLNFCYDQKDGVIYASDLDTLEKLGVDKEFISETYVNQKTPQEIIEKVESEEFCTLNKVIEIATNTSIEASNRARFEVEKQLDKLANDKVLLERIIKELVEVQKEQNEFEQEKERISADTSLTLKNSIGLLNKKIKETNEKVENLSLRFEAIVELLSEQASKSNSQSIQLPNIMKNGITVERIWSSSQDKQAAAILSIMFMMKKVLEEKGMRF